MRNHLNKYAAEFTGTFFLVFIGCGACIAHHRYASEITQVGVALAFGGVVMCMIYTLGHISGAHINPAVTIGFAAVRRFPFRYVLPYIIAQFLGALCASGVHLFTYGSEMSRAAQFGATLPASKDLMGAFMFEFILTFVLMFVIMSVSTDSRSDRGVSGLAIGMVVCFDCLSAGKCCGASMNPARSFGPAIFAGGTSVSVLWLYFLAPIFGAMIAALFYQLIRGEKKNGIMNPVF